MKRGRQGHRTDIELNGTRAIAGVRRSCGSNQLAGDNAEVRETRRTLAALNAWLARYGALTPYDEPQKKL